MKAQSNRANTPTHKRGRKESIMATYASKLRSSGVDGGTIRLNARGELAAGGIMEPFSAGTLGGAPSVFYVDGNVVSSGNGLSWLSAVKTLTEGLALAHAYASTSGNRAWAHRPTVYCCGDYLNEDLVILAEKTDIIGVGTTNQFDRCGLKGLHVPVTTNCWGSRWYNMHFENDSAGVIWTLTSVSGGIKFLNCTFSSRDTADTIAVKATAVGFLEIGGCHWMAGPEKFTTAAIDILAGNAADTLIHDNFIVGAIGVRVNASATATAGVIAIDNNVIYSSGKVIADASNIVRVTRNRCNTDVSESTPGDMWDGAAKYWCDNLITGSGGTTDQVPYISES